MARYKIPEAVSYDWNDQHAADIALEEVKQLTDGHPSYFMESSGLIDEKKQSIPQMFKVLKEYIAHRHTAAIKQLKASVESTKDMMIKIQAIEKSDRFKRFMHSGDLVSYTDKYALLYQESKKKYYELTCDVMAYNPEWIISKIDGIMESAKSFEGKERAKYIKTEMESTIEMFKNDFDRNHWFIVETEPFIKVVVYNKVKYSAAFKCALKTAKSYYSFNDYVENLATYELIYLQHYERVYERMTKSYGSDKDAKDYIDTFFKQLLHNESLSIEFNTKIIEKVDIVFRHQYEELCKLYDKLQEA